MFKNYNISKNVLIVITLLTCTLSVQAQNTTQQTQSLYDVGGNIGLYFGKNSTVGVLANGSFLWEAPRLVTGFRVSLPFQGGGVGTDYSAVMGPNAHPEDIYEIKESTDATLMLNLGYKITPNITLGGSVGISTTSIKYNAYDVFTILSPSGYYYTTTEGETTGVIGINGTIVFPISKILSLGSEVSYATVEGFTLGPVLNIKF